MCYSAKDVHEHREQEMMKNIQHYYEVHPFSKGIFLIGAVTCSPPALPM